MVRITKTQKSFCYFNEGEPTTLVSVGNSGFSALPVTSLMEASWLIMDKLIESPPAAYGTNVCDCALGPVLLAAAVPEVPAAAEPRMPLPSTSPGVETSTLCAILGEARLPGGGPAGTAEEASGEKKLSVCKSPWWDGAAAGVEAAEAC